MVFFFILMIQKREHNKEMALVLYLLCVFLGMGRDEEKRWDLFIQGDGLFSPL